MRRANCGSDHGYRLHLKFAELACGPCLDAHRIAWKEWRTRQGLVRELRPCGTRAAYKRHLRRGEKACWRCLWANRYGRDFLPGESPHAEVAA